MDLVLVQVLLVSPILLVRIIYATVQAFLSSPSSPGRNTWVYLGLLLIPDFISVAIYTICGFMVRRTPLPAEAQEYNAGKDMETSPQTVQTVMFEQAGAGIEGTVQSTQPPRTRRQRRRRPRGPIGMLIRAIRDARE